MAAPRILPQSSEDTRRNTRDITGEVTGCRVGICTMKIIKIQRPGERKVTESSKVTSAVVGQVLHNGYSLYPVRIPVQSMLLNQKLYLNPERIPVAG